MKQTAVDWLAENVCQLNISSKEIYKFLVLFEKAKEMEKDQMLEVSKVGCFSTFEFEQYYKETYEHE